jgi:hypothetical protein
MRGEKLRSSRERSRVLALGALAALALMFVVAGCGSSNSSSSSSSPSTTETTAPEDNGSEGSSDPAVKAAEAEYAEFAKEQPALEFPPLPKKPPTGLTITVATCALTVCHTETDAAEKAAEELGWKVTSLVSQLSPEAYQTTMNQIVSNPTEMAAIAPIVPNQFVSKQLKALQEKDVKIVQMAPPGDEPTPKGPVLAAVTGPLALGQSGRLMGVSVVNDKKGPANTAFIWDPAAAGTWQPINDEFTKAVESAGGTVDVVEVSSAEVGKAIPTQIVSYVQSHPDVEYLAFAVSDLDAGVSQALEAAGLSEQVKILSRAPQEANIEAIKNGTEWLSVAEENASAGYRAVDQLARIVEGVELGDLRNPEGWAQIITAEDAEKLDGVPQPEGYPEAFQEAWHLKP